MDTSRRLRLAASWTLVAATAAFFLSLSTQGSEGLNTESANAIQPAAVQFGGIGPDVIVGELNGTAHWGTVGSITAYSVGTTSCNKGDETLEWQSDNNNHPVIGQNLYRLKDQRMEQIGQGWLKHGFLALAQDACGLGCQNPGDGSKLGIGCSDPYGAGLNGDQEGFGAGGLGPRFEVNAATGAFEYPYAFQGDGGNAIYKRVQVEVDDMTPALNNGARYFVEGQYVTPDDSAAGNGNNNVSYREVGVENDLDIFFVAPTVREQAAIFAWQAIDGTVDVQSVVVPSDGMFNVATKVSDNGDGTWRYEYAVHNQTSHRSGKSFSVPMAPGTVITNIGFKDVPYHSGEPYDNSDWLSSVEPTRIIWQLDNFFRDGFESGSMTAWGDPDEAPVNALRWGTMYNFWFDADREPSSGDVTIDLYRSGTPASVTVSSSVPQLPSP